MALSTKPNPESLGRGCRVIYPVTPNGVEHQNNKIVGTPCCAVIYPVTPNGVEHSFSHCPSVLISSVIYPVTPNGVEHASFCRSTSPEIRCDLSGNA
jgi:hypothetical protein